MGSVLAVTFDFYNTLVYHHTGIGRGRQFQLYLESSGLVADAWEHQVLYNVFEYYGAAYSSSLHQESKRAFWTEFTRRLFERTNVQGQGSTDYERHAPAIRDIMGPNCFTLFEDALDTLHGLKKRGLRLGVISDWPKGLGEFCEELGLGRFWML